MITELDKEERVESSLIDLADAVVTTGTGSRSPGSLLNHILSRAEIDQPLRSTIAGGRAFHSPAAIFDAFAPAGSPSLRQHFEQFLDLVAAPAEVVDPESLQPGDFLVRRGEGSLGHLAMMVNGQAIHSEDLGEARMTPEGNREGLYVQVAESGLFPHSSRDGFARRLSNGARRLDHDQMIVRLKPGIASFEGFQEDNGTGIPASRLQWPGASQPQLDFMRNVYESQVRRALQRRSFISDVPESELAIIEETYKARTQAAASCVELLAAARAALDQQKRDGVELARTVERVYLVSAYRSASQQFSGWQRNFPRYYQQTHEHRATLGGGEHGAAAADYLAQYIGARLAAPGFSLHNNGRAVDFGTRAGGQNLGASTSTASIQNWRRSWFFTWLTENASRFNYYQNTSINEPWHWEYRDRASSEHQSEVESVVWPEVTGESIIIPAGREELSNIPLLRGHRGTQPDLILRWNNIDSATTSIDVVVHLHGYSDRRERMSIRVNKEPASGLDFRNPDNPADTSVERLRPTLAVLPRGNYFGGDSGAGYNFPALITPTGLRDLIEFSLRHFATGNGIQNLQMNRLIITAHSGGGAPLMRILQHLDPHEVHAFDALYGDASNLISWARSRIVRDQTELDQPMSRDARQYMQEGGGALRVFYRPGTQAQSLAVHRAVCAALPPRPRASAILSEWYRVERTGVSHNQIPRRFGWRLLADASVSVPDATQLTCDTRSQTDRPSHRPQGSATNTGTSSQGRQGGSTATQAGNRPSADGPPQADQTSSGSSSQPATAASGGLAGFTPAEMKALHMTTTFENGRPLNFGGLSGNFDGQGLSFGMLQWNIGTGSLQPLLNEFARDHAQHFDAIFGTDAARLRQVLTQNRDEQMRFIGSINDSRNHIIEPWAGYFRALADEPTFQQIQIAQVRPRMRAAERYARQFGLRSERGLAFMFDVVTAHGGGWLDNRRCHGCNNQTRHARIDARRAELEQQQGHPSDERQLLEIIANVLADTVNPRWRNNVLRRRMTIAAGRGKVHGHDFDLAREFGLGDAPWETSSGDPIGEQSSDVPITQRATSPHRVPSQPQTEATAAQYSPPGGRQYTPATYAFRCRPDPATVTPATLLPSPTSDADAATRIALQRVGLSDQAIRRLKTGGLEALHPIASTFGPAALEELFRRLRYNERQIANPPNTYDGQQVLRRRLGVTSNATLLAPRLLLTIPGHFRELARRAPNAQEAFALENLGWLIMRALLAVVNTATGVNWWLPPPPSFVTPFANPLPPFSQAVHDIITLAGLIDTTLSANDYNAHFNVWSNGLACRAWRLETGLDHSSQGAGQPFYTQLITIPAAIDISAQRQQVEQVWERRVAQTEGQYQNDADRLTHALTTCDNDYLRPLHLTSTASLGRLEMVYDFPARIGDRLISGLMVLSAIQPVVEQVFQTIHDLGWNDLLFQTAGAGCFRGVKLPADPSNPQRRHAAARRMSNHSLGIAIDFNSFENGQRTTGSMDPRITALFEAFHFRWGRCFGVSDPMHFEY